MSIPFCNCVVNAELSSPFDGLLRNGLFLLAEEPEAGEPLANWVCARDAVSTVEATIGSPMASAGLPVPWDMLERSQQICLAAVVE